MDATTKAKKTTRWLPLAITLAAFMALGALVAFGVTQARSNSGGNPELEPAPNFTIPLYSGGTGQFALSEQRGKPVVLNFWGSWCPPCLAEFPDLQATYDRYKGQGLVLVGVDVQDAETDARKFLAEQRTTFPTGPDLSGQILIDYRVIRFPTTVFITRDGRIYKKWEGLINQERLTAFVEELLKP